MPPTGTGKSALPPSSNGWLFSPSFPVDVRFLAVGALALGGFLTYAYLSKVTQRNQLDWSDSCFPAT